MRYRDGYAHSGILEEAMSILKEIKALKPLLQSYTELHITGHSLGAGLAAIITYELQLDPSWKFLEIHGIGFATPRVLSSAIIVENFTSIIYGWDIVPALSAHNVGTLTELCNGGHTPIFPLILFKAAWVNNTCISQGEKEKYEYPRDRAIRAWRSLPIRPRRWWRWQLLLSSQPWLRLGLRTSRPLHGELSWPLRHDCRLCSLSSVIWYIFCPNRLSIHLKLPSIDIWILQALSDNDGTAGRSWPMGCFGRWPDRSASFGSTIWHSNECLASEQSVHHINSYSSRQSRVINSK